MKTITNSQVAELINIKDAIDSMHQSFQGFNSSAQQARVRTTAGGVMLSTMGAVLPESGIAGAKVYTTINGRFCFVIVLFSTEDGRLLAVIEADTMTGLRTAAATAVATNYLANESVTTLAVIGTGVQARSHIAALCHMRRFGEILVAGLENKEQFAAEMTHVTGVPSRVVDINDAAKFGDVLITVTRSATPLFSGDLLQEGAFVAAIGASKGNVRELDDRAIERASALVVEWKPQAREEAGDLVMCKPGTFDWENVWELGQIVNGSIGFVRNPKDIVIYKAIGVGLEDVALAGLVYRRACERFGW